MYDTDLLAPEIEDRYLRALLEYRRLAEVTIEEFQGRDWSTRAKANLFFCISWYWDNINALPTPDMLHHTIGEVLKNDLEEAELVRRLAEKIYQIPAPDYKWLIKKLDTHIWSIKMLKAMYESAAMIKQGDTLEAKDKLMATMRDAKLIGAKASSDLDLTRADLIHLALDPDTLCCKTGIPALDEVIRGFYREELFVVMAPLNVGKSWFILNSAKEALIRGKHVLYFTLEMSRERVLQRLLQSISATVKPYSDTETKRAIQLWETEYKGKSEYSVSTLLDFEKLEGKLKGLRRCGGKLSIREYPSGVATIQDIERDILMYDTTFNKLPDLILVDGLLDLSFTGVGTQHGHRMGLTQAVKNLRRIAIENRVAVVVSHQANREALNVDVVETGHTSESLGIMQVCDTAVSLNQTKAESQLQKMRLFIMRARNQQKWKQILLFQSLDIGQFCLHSEELLAKPNDLKEVKQRRRARKSA